MSATDEQAADPALAETAVVLGALPWRVMATVVQEVGFGISCQRTGIIFSIGDTVTPLPTLAR